jgi:hypothetical protein
MSSTCVLVLLTLLSICPLWSLAAINGYDTNPIRNSAVAVLDPNPLLGFIGSVGLVAKRDLFGLRDSTCGANAYLCPGKRLPDRFLPRS